MKNCASCRFHSKQERLNPIGEADFGDIVEFNDDPQIVFVCTVVDPHKEIGANPIYCDKWEAPKKTDMSELDKMMERFNQRKKDEK